MFATEAEAWRMLEGTLRQAKKDGDAWPEKFQYTIIEVEPNVELTRLRIAQSGGAKRNES